MNEKLIIAGAGLAAVAFFLLPGSDDAGGIGGGGFGGLPVVGGAIGDAAQAAGDTFNYVLGVPDSGLATFEEEASESVLKKDMVVDTTPIIAVKGENLSSDLGAEHFLSDDFSKKHGLMSKSRTDEIIADMLLESKITKMPFIPDGRQTSMTSKKQAVTSPSSVFATHKQQQKTAQAYFDKARKRSTSVYGSTGGMMKKEEYEGSSNVSYRTYQTQYKEMNP